MSNPERSDGDVLLPCPFCGSAATSRMYSDDMLFRVDCSGCPATVSGFDQCKQDAIDAWNTRAPTRDGAEGAGLAKAIAEKMKEPAFVKLAEAWPLRELRHLPVIKMSPCAVSAWHVMLPSGKEIILSNEDWEAAAPPKPAPNYEAAALALGFVQTNGKWFATTSSPDRNTSQSWETAEQIFEWWGRASGNVVKPAPDAMREALTAGLALINVAFGELVVGAMPHVTEAEKAKFETNFFAPARAWLKQANATLAAPVPSPDGAQPRKLLDLPYLRHCPSPAVAAEPVKSPHGYMTAEQIAADKGIIRASPTVRGR